LFQGCPGGRRFRRHLSEHAHKEGAGLRLFDEAVSLVREPEAHGAEPATLLI
jgi:tRNA-dihydrouridine synthase A